MTYRVWSCRTGRLLTHVPLARARAKYTTRHALLPLKVGEGREGLIVHQTKYTSLLKILLALADLFSDQTVFRNSNAMNAKLHLTISDKFCFAFPA